MRILNCHNFSGIGRSVYLTSPRKIINLSRRQSATGADDAIRACCYLIVIATVESAEASTLPLIERLLIFRLGSATGACKYSIVTPGRNSAGYKPFGAYVYTTINIFGCQTENFFIYFSNSSTRCVMSEIIDDKTSLTVSKLEQKDLPNRPLFTFAYTSF